MNEWMKPSNICIYIYPYVPKLEYEKVNVLGTQNDD